MSYRQGMYLFKIREEGKRIQGKTREVRKANQRKQQMKSPQRKKNVIKKEGTTDILSNFESSFDSSFSSLQNMHIF